MLNFLSPKISSFGLDLSDHSIKIASLKKHGRNFYLSAFGRQEIPKGLIDNGEIKKEEELIGVIKEALRQVKGEKLNTKYCVVSLPETFSFVQVVKMPLMNQEELAEAMKWELEARVPMSKDEIYYDWQIINSDANAPKDHLDVLLGVLPKKTVDPYLAVLKKAGLKPLIFEVEPVATTRALIKNSCCDEPLIIVDLGDKRTSLFIFYGQAIYFTTELPVYNSLLVETLSQKLGIDQDRALQIKMKVGLNMKHPKSKVYQELRVPLLDMAAKIKNYIDFYNEHIMLPFGQGKNIKKVLLCGGGAMMSGLPEFLFQELKIPVEPGNPWINIYDDPTNEIPTFPHKDSLSFTTALGLALRNYD